MDSRPKPTLCTHRTSQFNPLTINIDFHPLAKLGFSCYRSNSCFACLSLLSSFLHRILASPSSPGHGSRLPNLQQARQANRYQRPHRLRLHDPHLRPEHSNRSSTATSAVHSKWRRNPCLAVTEAQRFQLLHAHAQAPDNRSRPQSPNAHQQHHTPAAGRQEEVA